MNFTSDVYLDIVDETCGDYIRYAFQYLQVLRDREDLYPELSLIFNSCKEFQSPSDIDDLMSFLSGAYEGAVQYDYPYNTTVFGPNTPANPATASCQPLIEYAKSGVENIWKLFDATAQGA